MCRDRRPLSEEQTRYAALDVLCLTQIFDKMCSSEASRSNRTSSSGNSTTTTAATNSNKWYETYLRDMRKDVGFQMSMPRARGGGSEVKNRIEEFMRKGEIDDICMIGSCEVEMEGEKVNYILL